MPLTTQQLIIAAIVVLAIGQGIILYTLSAPQSGSGVQQVQQEGPTTPGSSEAFSVGRLEEPAGEPIAGFVTSVAASSITIDTGSGEETYIINPNPEVVIATPKTDAEINADLEAYNARVEELMEDPEGNRQELENLVIPSPVRETETSLSSIRAGQALTLFLDDSGNVVEIAVQEES